MEQCVLRRDAIIEQVSTIMMRGQKSWDVKNVVAKTTDEKYNTLSINSYILMQNVHLLLSRWQLLLQLIEISTIKKVNLKGGTVIDGFPSVGLTNSIASICFMRSIKNELVAVLDSPESLHWQLSTMESRTFQLEYI